MKKLLLLLLLLSTTAFSQTMTDEEILRGQENQFIELLNVERTKKGLRTLVFNQGLYDTVSTRQANNMAINDSLYHTPDDVNNHCGEVVAGPFMTINTRLATRSINGFKYSPTLHWGCLMSCSSTIVSVRMESFTDENGWSGMYICVNYM